MPLSPQTRETSARALARIRTTLRTSRTTLRNSGITRKGAVVVAAPLAVVLTGATVTLGVVTDQPTEPASASSAAGQPAVDIGERSRDVVSRSSSRTATAAAYATVVDAEKLKVDQARLRRQAQQRREAAARAATQRAIENADTRRWTTTLLNLWPSSAASSFEDTLQAGKHVLVTGREADGRDEIVLGGESYWVTDGYLSQQKPAPERESAPSTGGSSDSSSDADTSGGSNSTGASGSASPSGSASRSGSANSSRSASTGTCSNGSSVPSGVSPNVRKVHHDVCANFPSVTSYGTFRSGSGDHASGHAVDAMVSGDLGWQVARYVRAHAGELGVKYVIHAQKIWSVQRSSEGWRSMEDRGGATANHYDHVHVSTY